MGQDGMAWIGVGPHLTTRWDPVYDGNWDYCCWLIWPCALEDVPVQITIVNQGIHVFISCSINLGISLDASLLAGYVQPSYIGGVWQGEDGKGRGKGQRFIILLDRHLLEAKGRETFLYKWSNFQLIDRVVRQKLMASWFWQQLESAPIHILTLTQCSYILLSFINRWNIEARTSHLVLETVGCGYRLCRLWCEFDMQGMYARWASRPLLSYRKQQPVNLLSQSLHFYTKPKLMFCCI